jgi:SWI/SNF-related matrix-associated actin-dependent regulator 1 of chromatin subfamily A
MVDHPSPAPAPALEAEVTVPEGGLVAIEYPGYVRNVDRALETFGGARGLGAMLGAGTTSAAADGNSAPPPARLMLRLRPADALSHPLTSDAPDTGRRALLLRIARPAGARRRARAEDGEGGGDGAAGGPLPLPTPEPPRITAAGLVTRTYRFTSLADAQYLALDGRAGAPSGAGGVAGAGADLSAGGGGGGAGRDVSSLPADAQPAAAEPFGAPAPFLMVPPRFLGRGDPVEFDFTADGGGGGTSAAAANGDGEPAAEAAAAQAAAERAAAVAAAEAAAEVALGAVLRQRLATIEFGAAVAPRAVPLDRAAAYLSRRTDRAIRAAANMAGVAAAAAAGAATDTATAAPPPACESIRPELDAFVSKLEALFRERPAWHEPVLRERSGLDALAAEAAAAVAATQQQQQPDAPPLSPSTAASRLRSQRLARDAAALLRASVYRFRTGPWRQQLVRRGYDPRRDPRGAAPGLQGVLASAPAAADEDAEPREEAAAAPHPAPPSSAARVFCRLRALPADGRRQWRVQARDVVAAAASAGAAAGVPTCPSLAPVRNRRVPTETTGWLSQTTLRELSVAATALYARARSGGAIGGEEEEEEEEAAAGAGAAEAAEQLQRMGVDDYGQQQQQPGSGRKSREGSAEEEEQEEEEGAGEEEEEEDGGGGDNGGLDVAAALSSDEGH